MNQLRTLLCLAVLATLAGCGKPGPSDESLSKFFADVAQEGSSGKSWTGACWAPGARLTIRSSDGLIVEATKEDLARIANQTVPKIEKFEVVDSAYDAKTKATKVTVRHCYKDQPSNLGVYTVSQDGGKLQIVAYKDATLAE